MTYLLIEIKLLHMTSKRSIYLFIFISKFQKKTSKRYSVNGAYTVRIFLLTIYYICTKQRPFDLGSINCVQLTRGLDNEWKNFLLSVLLVSSLAEYLNGFHLKRIQMTICIVNVLMRKITLYANYIFPIY